MIAVDTHARHRAAQPPASVSPLPPHKLDEASRFRQEDAEFLTSLCLDEQTGRMGSIVAGSRANAVAIAMARGHGEKIVGLMGRSLHNMKMQLLSRF
ncbi:hypothetical protein ABFT80_23050 [Mesorhizobium sp. SB112]|uniref:hypothetical protein n=1 Tax=Mesorhizobium sp. SB112 TaxID=3151853 RepID=UPI003267F6B5